MFNKFIDTFKIVLISFLSSSCVLNTQGVSGRIQGLNYGRVTTNKNYLSNAAGNCIQSYDYTQLQCQAKCSVGTHVGTTTEVATLNLQIQNDATLTTQTKDSLIANLSSAKEVCIQGATNFRQANDVIFNPNFCICQQGKSHLPYYPSCAATCQQYTAVDTALTLHASLTLSAHAQSHPQITNLANWCGTFLTGTNNTAPACQIEAFDGFNTTVFANPTISGNNLSINVTGMTYNKSLILQLSESFSKAKSDQIQVFLKTPTTSNAYPTSPLSIMPISQYTCLSKQISQSSTSSTSLNVIKQNYYFPSSTTPPSITPGNLQFVCHDIINGVNDSPLFTRFELIPNQIALWDTNDLRFQASPTNPQLPVVNDIIKEKYNLLAGPNAQATTVNLFSSLMSLTSPLVSTQSLLGFYMNPFLDSISGNSYCPTSVNYNDTTNFLMQAIGQVLGANDTEALYIAKREPINFPDAAGVPAPAPDNFIYIKEGLLKQIWFYKISGIYYTPNSITAKNHTIHFYWPADTQNPTIRKSNQLLYTIKSAAEINAGTSTNTTPPTVSPASTSDKRIGCIPKSL